MKTIITSIMSVALAGFAFGPLTAVAEEAESKEVTMDGTATCPKCDLGTADKCGTVLVVKEGENDVVYVLTGVVDDAWHKNVCKTPQSVTATGSVSEKDGEKTMEVTKIDMKEDKGKE